LNTQKGEASVTNLISLKRAVIKNGYSNGWTVKQRNGQYKSQS